MLVGAVVGVSLPAEASSGDAADSRLSADVELEVPGEVYDIRSLGAWREGRRAGTYRVVTLRGGFDRIQTVVIVQWMEQASGQDVPAVVATRRIELLDELGPITVSAVEQTSAPNELNLAIQVKNVVSGEQGSVEAVAGRPGQLTVEYTPTRAR
jgi:hypothetical protein